jgi:hypothetical protein
MKSSRLWLVTVAVLALAGCQNPWFEMPFNDEKYVLASGWYKPRPVVPEPVYCYRTLAKVDCYDTPRPEYGNRLVNYFGTEEP